MLESTIGSAEKELFNKEGTIDSIVEGFQEAARHSFEGISHELVYCMTPLQADLSKIKAKVSIWYGTEDSRISLEGAQSLKTSLNDCTLHVKEGYSEHLYYAFFEEMIG